MRDLGATMRRARVLLAAGVVAATAAAVVGVMVLPDGSSDPGAAAAERSTLKGWHLNVDNTGLAPAGVRCEDLAEYSGPDRPAAGTVIERKRISRPLVLSAGDITIRASCIQPITAGRGLPILSTTDNDTGQIAPETVTIEGSEFDGSRLSQEAAALTAAFIGIADLRGNYVHGFGSGLALMNTGSALDSVVHGNFVTDLVAFGDGATTGNHSDAFTVRDFDTSVRRNRTLEVTGNRFDCDSGNDTGALFVQTYAGDIGNLTVSGNLLEGGGYQLGLTSGFGHDYANVRAVDNRFTGTGWGPAYVQGGAGFDEWRDNHLNDPDAAGNRGASVPQP